MNVQLFCLDLYMGMLLYLGYFLVCSLVSANTISSEPGLEVVATQTSLYLINPNRKADTLIKRERDEKWRSILSGVPSPKSLPGLKNKVALSDYMDL